MNRAQCVLVREAEQAVSQTKLGPFRLKTKEKRLAMMASTVLVPEGVTSFSNVIQSYYYL